MAAMVVLIIPAAAQKATIYASYGGYTQMDACDNHDHWGGVNTAWGAVNVGVDFKVLPKFTLGPSYTFSSTSTKGAHPSHIAYHSVLLNAKYDYWRSGAVTLYAHGGLGFVVSHMQPRNSDSYNKSYFAGQISPLGVKLNLGNKLKFFGEVGFGSQGVAQLGFSYDL